MSSLIISVDEASVAEPRGPVADAPKFIVENFQHPAADAILRDRGIVVRKGDGNIQSVECVNGEDQIVVKARNATGLITACFRVTAPTGYLSVEIPKVFYIQAAGHAVKAKLKVKEREENVSIPKNEGKSVGEGISEPNGPATLLELRASS
ncbi:MULTISPECIES: hypothetical protein [unclassified Crossiella]|uniref:hypothetical protein n=1 Tax=unclassified Crossiella TaxID=2620835 RepID=UPI001FFFD59F|nr:MULTISPECIES: hypothetical protein [unclassified Crossiella]MCK2237409.1 hypothetical protein [Crossiella sp. S99.2]MCK2251064.1 hypothetical protein [Crossiella sp. S99.1]